MPTTHKKVILMGNVGGVATPLAPHTTADHVSVGEDSTVDLELNNINENINKLTESNYYLESNVLPIGTIVLWMGTSYPNGWLALDGSDISRTDYSELFALYGETYGSGDGSTTFTLPNQNANDTGNLNLPNYNYIVKALNDGNPPSTQISADHDTILQRIIAIEEMVGLTNK